MSWMHSNFLKCIKTLIMDFLMFVYESYLMIVSIKGPNIS